MTVVGDAPEFYSCCLIEVGFFQQIRVVAENKSTLILFCHLPHGICSECRTLLGYMKACESVHESETEYSFREN
jgi:hypothetical protein